MDITCISDLHGHYPTLEGGDLLIVAGDLTARDLENEYALFDYWLNQQKYAAKIIVAGNHDNFLQKNGKNAYGIGHKYIQFGTYLEDEGCDFNGFKIWGSPWTPLFEGVNPQCTAFMLPETELEAKFALIPDDVDILVTHGPPLGMLDEVLRRGTRWDNTARVGSASLLKALGRIRPKLHVFGHIHEGYAQYKPNLGWVDLPGYPIFVNCSHVNERNEPVNKPIRVIL